MNERRGTIVAIAVAITSALFRLIALQWLHPLNWDELELYRAARWIAEGRLPFRDFWEHHTPLSWFFYAPFTLLTNSPGVDAILVLRWVQVPVWIATFWLANVWMRNAGLSRFARWSAIAIACSSSFLMNPAVEVRLDPISCALFIGALVLWQRGHARAMFFAGTLFGLAGLTNLRLIPLLVLAALFLRIVDARAHAWRGNRPANWIFAGGIATVALALLYFAATHSLGAFVHSVFFENYIGDKYAQLVVGAFPHRLLVLFGVRVLGSDRLFELAGIDVGGIAILILGVIGLVRALRRWREPDDLFVMAFLEAITLIVVAGMKFVYVYHFEIVVILFLPLIAATVERIPRRGVVYAIFALAWCVNAFACIFRGKELDRAYQDFVMRELDARTLPSENVWAGIPWALHREPAYRFWFLPDMTRHLVELGYARPYLLGDVLRDPPAAVVVDHSVLVWISIVQRELAPYFVRHYMPVWSNVWVPALNVRLRAERPRAQWVVPRDGTYRLFTSTALARHRWFRDPLYVAAEYTNRDAERLRVVLPPPAPRDDLRWWIDGQPAAIGASVVLRKGQRVGVEYSGAEPLVVILLPGNDTVLFRAPPPGATLEASTSRETHVPQFGARIEP
jgi:hypothetical protein